MNWTVIVPIKNLSRAKSRLTATSALARAIALDTVAAITECTAVTDVVVVTDEPSMSGDLRSISDKIRVVDDPQDTVTVFADGNEPALNSAVLLAALQTSGPVAVVHSDLPALDPEELTAALALAEQHPRAMVADTEGRGTTVLTALEVASLRPQFGSGSFARHDSLGYVPLDAGQTLRRDVDSAAHLQSVLDWPTLGERTRREAHVYRLEIPENRDDGRVRRLDQAPRLTGDSAV